MTGGRFEEDYRTALAELGVSLAADDALHEVPPAGVPGALRAWYRVAGCSWLNSAHNVVLGPRNLRNAGDKVIFVEENQEIVVWGFDASSNADDPEVWQGQALAADDRYEWYSEEALLSRFLIEMLSHTITHGRPAP